MNKIIFFKKEKFNQINKLFPKNKFEKIFKFNNIETLEKSKKNDLSFFDSIKYKNLAEKTKASYCITTKRLEKFLQDKTFNLFFKVFKLINR